LLIKLYRGNKTAIHKIKKCFPREYLDEVIVLDLSSKENRAEFFGVMLKPDASKAVEMILAKGLENIKKALWMEYECSQLGTSTNFKFW
jgi:hypothetical protein